MKVLVTGGAGFIGNYFIRYMAEKYRDYQFTNLDALTYAVSPRVLEELDRYPNYRLVKGDITDRPLVMELFRKSSFDMVVHFAAESHVDRSIPDPGVFAKTNVLGTQVLLDAAKEYGVKRFHHISTDEVYGELPLDRPDLLFQEDSPLAGTSPYACSKAASDLFVLSYYKTYGLPVTISRCGNNYGPWQYPEKLIPVMICRALEDQPLPVYGDGLNVRDWVHVEDHCRAVDLILHDDKAGEVYNIGCGEEHTNIELVKRILGILYKPEDLITYVDGRLGHDLRYGLDCRKLKDRFSWRPMKKFDRSFEETVHWYENNLNIYYTNK